jgi:putative transposase
MRNRVDASLVQEALQRAVGRRQPAVGLIHHSDRGSPDACGAYQALLAEHDLRCRMSRQGDGLDKAVAERLFGSLQGACTSLQHCARPQEARDAVIAYIEMFYNSKRLHSYLGYVSPKAFEGCAKAA